MKNYKNQLLETQDNQIRFYYSSNKSACLVCPMLNNFTRSIVSSVVLGGTQLANSHSPVDIAMLSSHESPRKLKTYGDQLLNQLFAIPAKIRRHLQHPVGLLQVYRRQRPRLGEGSPHRQGIPFRRSPGLQALRPPVRGRQAEL